MVEQRKAPTAKEKADVLANGKCYVCADLGLDHAGFDGYESRAVHFDHYQTPFGNVGGQSGATSMETLPIHAATGGATADDLEYESSTSRNCHRLRSNDFESRTAYVRVLKARMEARTASFVDDVFGNKGRNPAEHQYVLPVTWSGSTATFIGKVYPVVSDSRPDVKWDRFLTVLKPSQVFTDNTSQVRPAARKTVTKMIHTFLIDGFPIFAPINARIDKCGHVVIFDGNHRATSHALSFGIDAPMPVMIWDIEPGPDCALQGQS